MKNALTSKLWHPPLPPALMAQTALALDLSAANTALQSIDVGKPKQFGAWIDAQCQANHCQWALGGYNEDRAIYAMSPLFGDPANARSVHLGVDFWLPANTPVFAAHAGTVHSLGNNARFGDYGGTVLIEHADIGLTSLYGHLASRSLDTLQVGQAIAAGQAIGWLGTPEENLGWPPHLHFQLIADTGNYRGDFPGVCHASERATWLARCPNPQSLIDSWCPSLVAA